MTLNCIGVYYRPRCNIQRIDWLLDPTMSNPTVFTTIEELRALTNTQLEKVNKKDIMKIIQTDPNYGNSTGSVNNDPVFNRIVQMETNINASISNLKADLTKMVNDKDTAVRKELTDLRTILCNQQRFLEQMDAKQHNRNVMCLPRGR